MKKFILREKLEEFIGLLKSGEISLMDSFYYNNKSTENIDSGISRGIHRFVKIWKQNGEVFEFKNR